MKPLLDLMNEKRAMHGAPARVWDNVLAGQALGIAKMCAMQLLLDNPDYYTNTIYGRVSWAFQDNYNAAGIIKSWHTDVVGGPSQH
jgi:hypothetical protein